jgi:gas vesicle protein
MADNYDRFETEGSGGGGFMLGLLTGTVLGAGLGMLLAPKAGAELRGAIGEQARNLGTMASEQYRKASEQASGWAERGRDIVDRTREAVHRGAEEARGFAGAATSSGGSGSGSNYPSGTPYSGQSAGDINRS